MTTPTNPIVDDPWASATNPVLPTETPRFWGQATVETWYCVLEKGIGKRPYDPNVHPMSDRRTAIRFAVTALPEHNLKFGDVYREYIAEEWGKVKPWNQITLPSIRDAGVDPRSLTGRWVCIELVPEGRTYTSATTGETKESTTIRLSAVYADEAACRAAYHAERGQTTSPAAPAAPAAPTNGNGANPEQAVALKFLGAFVTMTQGDLGALAKMIAGNPVVSKYYTINSPETVQLVGAL